jgi:hypothetical protein
MRMDVYAADRQVVPVSWPISETQPKKLLKASFLFLIPSIAF